MPSPSNNAMIASLLDDKLARARAAAELSEDLNTYKALNAIIELLEMVFGDHASKGPQFMAIDAAELAELTAKKTEEKKPAAVKAPKGKTAGEMIGEGGGLYL